MDNSFMKVAVQVPHLSGFDKSHQNLLTSKVGTITPVLIDELIPGSKVHLNVALSAQLPPLAADTFMRCQVKLEAFFCPFRLLAGSFESWFTDTPVSFQFSSNLYTDKLGFLPVIGGFGNSTMGPDGTTNILDLVQGVGTLHDYLGMKTGRNYLNFGFCLLFRLFAIIVFTMIGIETLLFSVLFSSVLSLPLILSGPLIILVRLVLLPFVLVRLRSISLLRI